MIWFIIYFTITGWQVNAHHGTPPEQAGCYFPADRPGSHFCVVIPDEERAESNARRSAFIR